jgi:hypothetical protein
MSDNYNLIGKSRVSLKSCVRSATSRKINFAGRVAAVVRMRASSMRHANDMSVTLLLRNGALADVPWDVTLWNSAKKTLTKTSGFCNVCVSLGTISVIWPYIQKSVADTGRCMVLVYSRVTVKKKSYPLTGYGGSYVSCEVRTSCGY